MTLFWEGTVSNLELMWTLVILYVCLSGSLRNREPSVYALLGGEAEKAATVSMGLQHILMCCYENCLNGQ